MLDIVQEMCGSVERNECLYTVIVTMLVVIMAAG